VGVCQLCRKTQNSTNLECGSKLPRVGQTNFVSDMMLSNLTCRLSIVKYNHADLVR